MHKPSDPAPVRVGVLGASSIARRRTLPAMRDLPEVTIVAIASRDLEKAERFAAEFDCAAVHGYEPLIDRDDIDAVYVSVPNALHHPWARRFLEHGKHVLAEKPLTTAAADTAELARLAAERGLVLRENIAFVHHGLHRHVAELLAADRIGRLRHIDASFCFPPLPASDVRYRPELGGGALLDAGIYPVRLAQYFLGDELTVAGAVLRDDPHTGVDVAGSALLAAATGETVTLTFGFEHGYGAEYTLWGSTGRLTVDRAFTPPATLSPLLRIDEQDHAEQIVLPAEHQFATSVASFAGAVRRTGATGADPGHAAWAATTVRTAELLDRIADSAMRVTAGTQS
ncbi:Gfo/Idh/MocA family oxidoreductase [Streptomyces sp. ME19-01-6]|uniref:Gfo/Idh/MocA family protein n=1 Tax=Streptomyces sp. ME19-01-6 TaxID=3028686 RepID=UPI0029BF1980|nr:Gfo/Idh/MocA family oxidoreductase [Streptomyces sp. ME19-01-6]MDX3232329.1 Gfo/Idh/MocA family oxidoreductase [Streptomyces sp. ME19-01-6]